MPTGPAPKVKIFGERNTSTNALSKLIRTNSGSFVLPATADEIRPGIQQRLNRLERLHVPAALREGMIDRVFRNQPPPCSWKHAATLFDDAAGFEGIHVVFCLRHPASWLLGLHRRPYHLHGPRAPTLAAFLGRRWHTVQRERLGGRAFDPISLLNVKVASYLGLIGQLEARGIGYSLVRHEDFATGQAAVFDQLRPVLSRARPDFTPLTASTKETGKDAAYYADYYGNRRWLSEIDTESRARISAEVDWQSFARLGYAFDL